MVLFCKGSNVEAHETASQDSATFTRFKRLKTGLDGIPCIIHRPVILCCDPHVFKICSM